MYSYPLVNVHISMETQHLQQKSAINGPRSIAVLVITSGQNGCIIMQNGYFTSQGSFSHFQKLKNMIWINETTNDDAVRDTETTPLWQLNVAVENSFFLMDKIQYFHGYFPYLCQSLPEGISHEIPSNPIKPPFSYGFPMVIPKSSDASCQEISPTGYTAWRIWHCVWYLFVRGNELPEMVSSLT